MGLGETIEKKSKKNQKKIKKKEIKKKQRKTGGNGYGFEEVLFY